jgi:hypothetical protein
LRESVAEIGDGETPPPLSPPRRGEGDPTERDDAFWAPIQADYETGSETLDAVVEKYDITKGALMWRAKTHVWRRRNKRMGASGPSLLARLFRLLERQVFQLESETSPMSDKEAAMLGRVAATLEKLMQIENASASPKAPKPHSKDLEELRKKVARRFEELARR